MLCYIVYIRNLLKELFNYLAKVLSFHFTKKIKYDVMCQCKCINIFGKIGI